MKREPILLFHEKGGTIGGGRTLPFLISGDLRAPFRFKGAFPYYLFLSEEDGTVKYAR